MKKSFLKLSALLTFMLLSFSCTTDSNPLLPSNSLSGEDVSGSVKVWLPLNLEPYNRNPRTKLSDSDIYNSKELVLDSLLDYANAREEHFYETGWIYIETPFKSNGSIAASLTFSGDKNFGDSIVPVKFYHLIVGNQEENQLQQYVVTMIPARHYYQENKDFSFLDKRNFSGAILYSSLKGDFIRSEIYDNGVLTFSRLAAKNESITKRTKSDSETKEQLNPIIVMANRKPNWNANVKDLKDWFEKWSDDNIHLSIVPESDYIDADGRGGGGGNGNTRNKETYYTVTFTKNICGKIFNDSRNILKGNSFKEKTPMSDGQDCLFMCWVASPSDYSCNSAEIEFIPKCNVKLEAKYTSKEHNPACYELVKTLLKGARLHLLSIVYGGFSDLHEFGSYWNGTSPVSFIGENCRLVIEPNSGDVVLAISHSHNKGNYPFPSPTDFANFCYWYMMSGCYTDFIYDITCRNEDKNFCSLIMEVEDVERFRKKINEFSDITDISSDFYERFKDLFHYDNHYHEKPGICCQDYYMKLSEHLKDFGIKMNVVITKTNSGFDRFFWSNTDPLWGDFFGVGMYYDMNALNKCFASFTE